MPSRPREFPYAGARKDRCRCRRRLSRQRAKWSPAPHGSPGFTIDKNIAAAMPRRTPLLVLASNVQMLAKTRVLYPAAISAANDHRHQEVLQAHHCANGFTNTGPTRSGIWKTGVPVRAPRLSGEFCAQRFTDPSTLTDYYDKANTGRSGCPSGRQGHGQGSTDQPGAGRSAGAGVFQPSWEPLLRGGKESSLWSASRPDAKSLPTPPSGKLSPDALMSADSYLRWAVLHAGPRFKSIGVKPSRSSVAEDLGRNGRWIWESVSDRRRSSKN